MTEKMTWDEAKKLGDKILRNGRFKEYGGYYLEFEKDGLILRVESVPNDENLVWIIIDSNGNWLYNPY